MTNRAECEWIVRASARMIDTDFARTTMNLRHRSDIRTLVWAFALMPGLVFLTFVRPSAAGWLLPVSLYASYSAAVIAHNHNHCPTFTGRRMNAAFSTWTSIFYGFPTYGWIPTHNENHHRYLGREGDATVRAIPGAPDRLWLAVTHFFRSTSSQGPLLTAYRARLRSRSTRAWLGIWLQYVVVYGVHLAVCAFAIARYGTLRGTLVYVSSLGLPALGALWGIMATNWIQHVGCDPGSHWNHSRNFVARWFNALVFDNGYHTAHHARPGLHWSQLRAAHEAIASEIAPSLCVSSPLRYVTDTYLGYLRPVDGLDGDPPRGSVRAG